MRVTAHLKKRLHLDEDHGKPLIFEKFKILQKADSAHFRTRISREPLDQWLIKSRACLRGCPETRTTPSKGLLRSRIVWIAPATATAQRNRTTLTVALGGANRPKLTKSRHSQN